MEAAAAAFQRALAALGRSTNETTPRFFKHFFGHNAAGLVVEDPDQLPPSRCRLNKLTRKVKDAMLDDGVSLEQPSPELRRTRASGEQQRRRQGRQEQHAHLAAAMVAAADAAHTAGNAAAEPSVQPARWWLLL
ncbi:hypothetical protein ABPG75_003066 [Micractinium tetrahymenae]